MAKYTKVTPTETHEVILDEQVVPSEVTRIQLVTEKEVPEKKMTKEEKAAEKIEADRNEPKTSKEVEEIGKKASTGVADTVPTAGYIIKD